MSTAHLYVPKAQYEAKVAELEGQLLLESHEHMLACQVAEKALADLSEAQAQLRQANEIILRYENREASCCPEDVGCDEFVARLQSQLRQEREARETAERFSLDSDHFKNAVCKRSEAQLAQLKEDRDTWMGQAKRANLQVAQLQATVARLTKGLQDVVQTCKTGHEIFAKGVAEAALGRDSACPAPAKEGEHGT